MAKKKATDGMSFDKMMESMHMPGDIEDMEPRQQAIEKVVRAEKAHEQFVRASLDPNYAAILKARLREGGHIKTDADFETLLKKSIRGSRNEVKKQEEKAFAKKLIRPLGISKSRRSRKHYK